MLSRILKRAEISGRVDDNTDVFRRRYAGHMKEITAVIGAFAGKVIDVRATRSIREISSLTVTID